MKATEEQKRRRQKNIVLGLVLVALAALFYVITLVKLGSPA